MPGQHILRQSVQGMGELYLFQLPLILYGVFYLIAKQKRMAILFFAWLLLYPIGSMFTLNENPYATRSIIGVLPFSLLSGIGLWYMLLLFKHMGKYFYICGIALFSGAMIISFMFFVHLYFQEYPFYSSGFWGWQYGAQPIVEYFLKQEKKYDALYMEGDIFNSPDIFLKFFSPHDCTNCFIGDPAHDNNTSLKQLFAVTPDYILAYKLAFHTQKTIYYPNGQKAFLIGTIDHL